MRTLVLSIVVMALTLLGAAHLVAAQSNDESAVAQAVEAFRNATLKADRSQFEALCADQLSYGHSAGRIETKAQFINALIESSAESRANSGCEPGALSPRSRHRFQALLRFRLSADLRPVVEHRIELHGCPGGGLIGIMRAAGMTGSPERHHPSATLPVAQVEYKTRHRGAAHGVPASSADRRRLHGVAIASGGDCGRIQPLGQSRELGDKWVPGRGAMQACPLPTLRIVS